MVGTKNRYQFGAIEDILRESGAEATEPDRTEEWTAVSCSQAESMFTCHAMKSTCMRDIFCSMEDGQLEPLHFLTVIYDRTDKEFLYDAEENFVDTVHEWLKGQYAHREQLEQEPCEVKGIREEP